VGGNSHVVIIPAHASLENVLRIECARDFSQRLMRILVPHDRSSCDYAQVLGIYVTEPRNELLGKPIAEVLL
jgi:hypothetical protein